MTMTAPQRVDLSAIDGALEPARTAVREGALPGVVVGVADSSGVLVVETIAGPKTPKLRPDGLFFLASVTKPVVATAFMRLVDAGRVDLHAPIATYVPAFTGPGKEKVTAWHVLTHTSGIPDQDWDVIRRERPSAARMLDLVCRTPLKWEPGSRYEYCSGSFYLLAETMARLEARPFPAALRSLLLDPIGMPDTSFDPRHDRSRIVVVEGIPLGNRILRELLLRFLARAAVPGGGLWGTADDLLRFGQALLPRRTGGGNGILSAAAIAEMTREQTAGILEIAADGTTRDPRYALGWGKPRTDGGVPSVIGWGAPVKEFVPASPGTFTHGGATGTRLWIDPDQDLVFVFLTNVWGAEDAAMFATLAEIYKVVDARS